MKEPKDHLLLAANAQTLFIKVQAKSLVQYHLNFKAARPSRNQLIAENNSLRIGWRTLRKRERDQRVLEARGMIKKPSQKEGWTPTSPSMIAQSSQAKLHRAPQIVRRVSRIVYACNRRRTWKLMFWTRVTKVLQKNSTSTNRCSTNSKMIHPSSWSECWTKIWNTAKFKIS